MSRLDRILGWRPRRPGGDLPAGMVPAAKIAAVARRGAQAAPEPDEAERELLARRERLTERFTLLQADLGGVFYEMAVRDHVRLDVLTRKAAELQRVDVELQEVERLLRGDGGPPTAICPSCTTRHGAQARYCAHCGHALQQPATAASSPNGQAHGLTLGGDDG